MTRARVVEADPHTVWAIVADPRTLPSWWPGVDRVEEASAEAWTEVMRSDRGKEIRADFTRTSAEPPRLVEWRQEVEESPFERFMSAASTRISLEEADGGTRIELRATRHLRGLALLGGPLVRRATRRQADAALAGLAKLAESGRRG